MWSSYFCNTVSIQSTKASLIPFKTLLQGRLHKIRNGTQTEITMKHRKPTLYSQSSTLWCDSWCLVFSEHIKEMNAMF